MKSLQELKMLIHKDRHSTTSLKHRRRDIENDENVSEEVRAEALGILDNLLYWKIDSELGIEN